MRDRGPDLHEQLSISSAQLLHVADDGRGLLAIAQGLRQEPAREGDAVVLVTDQLTSGLASDVNVKDVVRSGAEVHLHEGDVFARRREAIEAVLQELLGDGDAIHGESLESTPPGAL